MNKVEKFWLEDPSVLLKNFNLIPNANMTSAQKLNALTRLLVLITIVVYFLGYEQYFTILGIGILFILVLHKCSPKEHFQPEISNEKALNQGIRQYVPAYDSKPHGSLNEPCWFNQNTDLINAKYELTPPIQFNHDDASKRSYANAKYELTPLTDTYGFRQIWRSEPEMCGGFSMIPDPITEFPVEQPLPQGQCNYIVRSNIDHLPISQAQNGLASVRPMAEEAFNQSILDFRDSIRNEHSDRFIRERKHNCTDMKLFSTSEGGGGSI